MKKTTHGGARQGAGRPLLDQATTTISFRVPMEMADDLKIAIKKLITKKTKTMATSKKAGFKLDEDKAKIELAKSFLESRPFATRLTVALETKIPYTFILKNWEKINH